MTRKEEVELAWFNKAVQSNHRYDEKSFKEAVEWADKTMIEKACEWLKKMNLSRLPWCFSNNKIKSRIFLDRRIN